MPVISITSLRQALLSRFILLSATTAILVGVIFVFIGFRPMMDKIAAEQLKARADQVEADLTALFTPAEQLLRISCPRLAREAPPIDDPTTFNRLFLPMLEVLPQMTSIVAGTSTGQGWMLLRRPDGSLRNRLTDVPHWGERHLIVEQRRGHAPRREWQHIAYDARARPWYIHAMATPEHDTYWTSPYTFFTTGDPGLTASTRIRMADGRFFVLGFDIMLRDLSKSTMRTRDGSHGLALVLTDDGRVLALPARPAKQTEAAWLAKILGPAERLGLAPVTDALAAWHAAPANGQGVLAYRSGTAPWLANIRPYRLGEERFWIVTLAPEADFAPAWQPIAIGLALSLFLALLVAIGIAHRQASRLSRPLERLAETSKRIGRLDFAPPPPMTSEIAEVAQLASAHAAMAEQLRCNQDMLSTQAVALRDSEQHFRNLANSGSTLIWTSGVDMRCDYFNEPWLRYTGRRLEQELGDGWTEGVHPDDYRRCLDTYVQAFQRREPFGMDYRLRTASGEYRWLHDEGMPRYGSQGEFLGYIGYCFDITDRKQAEDQIRNLAYFDPLTNLPNRRLLMDRLGKALSASNRNQLYGALLILDLDNFKSLNDTQGHDAGDQLLVEVAGKLLAGVRQDDTVARLGGDEYVVLLEGLDLDESAAARQAEAIGEKIRVLLNQPYASASGNHSYLISTSIGLTLFRGQEASPENLLKQADVALYQAKGSGKNVIRFFNPAMQAEIDARIAMESRLRHAIAHGELHLHYQPQFDREGRLIGAEALLRWLPPGQPAVPPDRFIGLAEETGMILQIGDWVLDTACHQLRRWRDDDRYRHLTLAVNVSPAQFRQPNFADHVETALTDAGIVPDRLKLEVTERVVLDQVDTVVEQLESIRRLGVGLSMDDFGTGYSSLSYLKRLPLDQLKIDRSFIRDIGHDANDAAIVQAILAMSRSLGLTVIAEGVETLEQFDFLREHDCAGYQGYLFGRPVAIEDWDRAIAAAGRLLGRVE